MAQIFFHYVKQNGPFTDHAYDKKYNEEVKIYEKNEQRKNS